MHRALKLVALLAVVTLLAAAPAPKLDLERLSTVLNRRGIPKLVEV